ncbi:MAG TPA: hypothetical protein DEB25_02185, partial [Desulfobulbaceae bacterium]|nr:hypothetical protein [Desulfobulbaceae bacterium]
MKRFGKIIPWLLLALVAAVLAVGGAAVAFFANPKALPWLVAGVEKLTPGFTVRNASGRFFSSWSLEGMSYRRGDFFITVDNLRLRWRAEELPHGLLAIDKLTASGIRLELPSSPSLSENKTADKPRARLFIPPWLRLRLNTLVISDARLFSGSREVLAVDNFSGGGEFEAETVRIKNLNLAGRAAGKAESIRFTAS